MQLVQARLKPGARGFLARTIDAIELAAKTPQSECRKDVWDLRVWGFKGNLSFVGGRQPNHPGHQPMPPVGQDWLRHAVKRWAAARLPLLRSESMVETMVAAVGRWSVHLARRADGGHDPTALSKDDITSFLAGLRVLVNQGQLHPHMHFRTVQFLRRFLRDGRELPPDGGQGEVAQALGGVG
jgi:hypothetical protein